MHGSFVHPLGAKLYLVTLGPRAACPHALGNPRHLPFISGTFSLAGLRPRRGPDPLPAMTAGAVSTRVHGPKKPRALF